LWIKVLFVGYSGSAQNAAEYVSPATVAIALVSIPGVLPIAFVIAAHKALTKSLRGGILVVARTLRVVALPTLSITGAGVQASLVTLVQLNLIPVVVLITVAIAPVAAITIVARSTVSPIAVASPLPVSSFIISIPMLLPLFVPFIITVALTLVPPIIIPILRLSGNTCHGGYAKNKSERQNKPAYFSAKIFHICRISLSGERAQPACRVDLQEVK
jgi:hypothetical protein